MNEVEVNVLDWSCEVGKSSRSEVSPKNKSYNGQ